MLLLNVGMQIEACSVKMPALLVSCSVNLIQHEYIACMIFYSGSQ